MADYGENALIEAMLRGWPDLAQPEAAMLTSAFTRAKFVLLGGALAIWLRLGLAARGRKEE